MDTKMKAKFFLVVVLLAVLILDVSAEKVKKLRRKKVHRKPTESPIVIPEPNVSQQEEAEPLTLETLEKAGEERYQEAEKMRLKEIAREVAMGIAQEDNEIYVDACTKVHCSAGRICELNAEGEAECICIKECPVETDDRRKVCTNHNETWGSDCEVHRQRCLCMNGLEGCNGPIYHHVQVDYYGECKEMPECIESEMSDFPRRMRDWLFNIMRDLADRHELSSHYLKMEREAENNLTRRWANAAIWKWCDLDANDNDRYVSRHELFPIRAPLMSLEHCIGPFLNSCDIDNDHRITLTEWGKCLQIEEEELEDRCDEFNEYD